MKTAVAGFVAALVAVLAMGIDLSAVAQEPVWKVKNRMHGKTKGGEVEKAEDVSGIACDADAGFPRLCLVVDDETQGAQMAVLQDGLIVAGDFLPLIAGTLDGKPLELDAEAVAYADGAFYVTGSHGRPRHESNAAKEAENLAKAEATRKVFRIGLPREAVDLVTGKLTGVPQVDTSEALAPILAAMPDLGTAYDNALSDGGLTIEGLAARKGSLFFGLRGPVLDGRDAVIVEVPAKALFDGAAAVPKLHRLDLGVDTKGKPRGIRDLAASGDGFLLIAGPVQDPAKKQPVAAGDYALYAWDGHAAEKLQDFPRLGTKLKPEALLPIARDGETLRLMVMFDGGKEGAPRAVTLALP